MNTVEYTNENVNAHSGLHLIGKLLAGICSFRNLFCTPPIDSKHIPDADILVTQIGLLAQGRTHYQDVELFRQDQGSSFGESLGLKKIPSAATLRQRLENLAEDETTLEKLEKVNLSLLQAHSPTPISVNGRLYIPNDIDVTPMDNSGSKRENVQRTYKGCDGFAPNMSNLGLEGWLLHHELRPGAQHSQNGTPEFLKHNIDLLDELNLKHPVIIRMDSGYDSAENIEILRDSEHFFIIKRNLRKEDPVKWLSLAMALGEPECPREGKEVYTGSVEHLHPGGEKSDQEALPCAFRVTRRTIDKEGQPLLIDDIDVEMFWTNLGEEPKDIVSLYQDHGTSEQYHSEFKSDLGLERFPSNGYITNKLFMALGAVAYNLLRSIEYRARNLRAKWPKFLGKKGLRLSRRRVGSVIRDLVCVAGKLVRHGGRTIIKVARGWPWSDVIIEISRRLAPAR